MANQIIVSRAQIRNVVKMAFRVRVRYVNKQADVALSPEQIDYIVDAMSAGNPNDVELSIVNVAPDLLRNG